MESLLKILIVISFTFFSCCGFGCPAFRSIDTHDEEWSSYEYTYISRRAHLGDEAAALIIFDYDSNVNRKGIHAIEWLYPYINRSENFEAKLAYVHRAINFPELIASATELDRVLSDLIKSEDPCILPTAYYLKAVFIEIKKESGYRCYYQKAAFLGNYLSIKRLDREYLANNIDGPKKMFWDDFSKYTKRFWDDQAFNNYSEEDFLIGDLNFESRSQLESFESIVSDGLSRFSECAY